MSYFHGKKAFLQLYLSGARCTNDLPPVSLGQELIISNWCSAGFSPLTPYLWRSPRAPSFHHFPSHFSIGQELLLSEEDFSGDLQTGDDFQEKLYFTLQYFCSLCWAFLSHPQVYLAMFHCQKHAKQQRFMISKLGFCHFLSTDSMCSTGLPLCSSWNDKKIMEVCGISHNSKINYCSNQTQFFYDPPKSLFQHLFLKHSTRTLIWKLCITVSRKFIYCHVHFPHDSIVKCWSLTI